MARADKVRIHDWNSLMAELNSSATASLAAAKVAHDEGAKIILRLANRIGVREYRRSDVAALQHHANNKKVWDNLRDRMPHPYTTKDAEWWITDSRNEEQYVRSGPWTPETGSQGPRMSTRHAITVDDVAVGTIGLEFGSESDIEKRVAELGYWLGEEYWGRGIMRAVVPAYVDWVWRTWDRLVRLHAGVLEWNVPSGKVLLAAGFEFEGKRKASVFKNGRICNDLMYGAVREGVASD